MTDTFNFRVIIDQDEDGIFVASIPAVPGCHSQGESYEEAIRNVKEAVGLCLEVAKTDKVYYDKIDWSETDKGKSRFLGITQIPVSFKLTS
jgi:predicted RNase H-like HicB family nuclease